MTGGKNTKEKKSMEKRYGVYIHCQGEIEYVCHVKSPTFIRKALLQYHKTMSIICEICVDESKGDIDCETAIQKIRDCLREM